MAALTPVYGLAGANSTAFQITMGSVNDTVANAALALGVTASGQLATFLGTSFANDAAAETAFRAIGGKLTYRQTGGVASTSEPIFKFTASTSTPVLDVTVVGTTNAVFEVQLEAQQSITK